MPSERWHQIEELYHAALEREPDQRGAFLDQACAGSGELRQEVESLLAHEASGSGLLAPFAQQAGKLLRGFRGPQHFTPGTQLGPYSVLAPLGAGGMGEVYRARDTRLDRIVAVKVLPAVLRDDPEFQKRFEREARAVSSLNHPHICALYDIGSVGGIDYLVMEYLEGETLTQRMASGPLPLPQVLKYGIQIADALAHAHAQGVLHRDLKPGNIMLTKSGAKLLDFGLAKLRASKSTESVTVTDLTEAGTILGTLHYMSPEQLEGKPAEAASDIFSLGAVLYEMAAGGKAFTGESRASVIAAVLKSEPPPIFTLPAGLDRIVRACLAKKPDERWQSVRDLGLELKWMSEREPSIASSVPDGTYPKRGKWVAAGLCLLAGVLIGGLIAWWAAGTRPEPRAVVRLSIPVTEMDFEDKGTAVALSPDGTLLVYAAGQGADSRLYLRPIDQLQSTPIAGTEGAFQPFFSPDGHWVAFLVDGKLKKVPITGGVSQPICQVIGELRGADWAADGMIFFGRARGGLSRVSASGGTPQAATTLDVEEGELSHTWPKVLPGSGAVLFTVRVGEVRQHISVESLATHQRHRLTTRGTYARYAPSGHLVYVLDGSLQASPFDVKRLETTGPPVPVLENVEPNALLWNAQFALSESGSLAYVPGVGPGLRTLVWVDRQGAVMPLRAPERLYEYPRLAPDGQRLAVGIADKGRRDVWIYDLGRDVLARLTHDGGSAFPEWSPDGKRVVFGSSRAGQLNLYMQAADGSGEAERLLTSSRGQYAGSWSPDGRLLSFMEFAPGGYAIWVLPLEGERKPRLFLHDPRGQLGGRISPDGRWLAYISGGVYVSSFPSGNGKWQISGVGGELIWARNGRELFYRVGDKMMAVGIERNSSLTMMKPRLLFTRSRPGLPKPGVPSYDVSPDGQRFLMVKESQVASTPAQLNVVLNWVEELKTHRGGRGER